MRPLFTDGWNSFWHVFFGVISARYTIIIPAFILYQVIDWHDKNMLCDLNEFFIGYKLYYILYILFVIGLQYKIIYK